MIRRTLPTHSQVYVIIGAKQQLLDVVPTAAISGTNASGNVIMSKTPNDAPPEM